MRISAIMLAVPLLLFARETQAQSPTLIVCPTVEALAAVVDTWRHGALAGSKLINYGPVPGTLRCWQEFARTEEAFFFHPVHNENFELDVLSMRAAIGILYARPGMPYGILTKLLIPGKRI